LTAGTVGAMASWRALGAERDWSGKNPIRYPDPDIISLDKRFDKIKIGNSAIQRLYTGTLWSEGPAWNGVGRYLVWSDIPNDRQLRWLEEDGHVSTMRQPSAYSNGNTFDYEGRQLSC
jgi:gluconolactonase